MIPGFDLHSSINNQVSVFWIVNYNLFVLIQGRRKIIKSYLKWFDMQQLSTDIDDLYKNNSEHIKWILISYQFYIMIASKKKLKF